MEKTSAVIRRKLSLKCAKAGIPVSGTFELTPRCNLSCRMCYVRLTPEEMAPIGQERTAEEWLAFAEEARDAGMLFLLITGGEPMLRSDFAEIYEGLAKMGLSININTNGTLFSEKVREVLHRFPPAKVNVTLYGTSGEDYEKMCGNAKAYDRVLDTLNWLKQEKILTHLNATMTPENEKCWEAYEEFAKERNLELRMTAYCFPPARRGECREFSRLSPEKAGEMAVKDLWYREGVDAVRKRRNGLSQQLSSCKLDLGDPLQCLAGSSQFWVRWDGTMLPCGMLNEPAIRPEPQKFAEAWESVKEETKKIRLCPDCTGCPEKQTCMNCAAVTYTETGRFDGKPEYMCKLNRAYREALEKYSEENTEIK